MLFGVLLSKAIYPSPWGLFLLQDAGLCDLIHVQISHHRLTVLAGHRDTESLETTTVARCKQAAHRLLQLGFLFPRLAVLLSEQLGKLVCKDLMENGAQVIWVQLHL